MRKGESERKRWRERDTERGREIIDFKHQAILCFYLNTISLHIP
jgi:hypothetical protein